MCIKKISILLNYVLKYFMLNFLLGKFAKIGLTGRILFFFTTLLVTSLAISSFFFQKVYSNIMVSQVSEASIQTLSSISSNIKIILKNVNNSSKVILSDENVQRLLKSPNGYKEIDLKNSVNRTLYSMMGNYDEIFSIYIIDKLGYRYYADRVHNQSIYFNSDFYAKPWARMRELNGSSYVIRKAGDIFYDFKDDNFVSNIRGINDLESQKPIGAIIINISTNMLAKSYSDIIGRNGTQIFILDDKRDILTSSGDYTYKISEFVNSSNRDDINFTINFDDHLIYSSYTIEPYNWEIIAVMALGGGKPLFVLMITSLFIFLALAILVFIGSVVTARMITKPINILVDSMATIGQGDITKAIFTTSIKEFNTLRDGYNAMTDEIDSLISRVVVQEKVKRKAELNTLHAQIKPHFLYNTFDSISALSLMGKNEDVYTMVSALGSFYRISLSKGQEIIALSKELEALRNYLDIMRLRYNNFNIVWNIDHSFDNYKVLKLVLQPFVENSIYHGIKPKGECGTINISTFRRENSLFIIIMDDGIGMDESTVCDLFKDSSSFGVRGTIKRVHLYYGRDDLIDITSKRGVGTTVSIKLPIDSESEDG